MKSNHNVIKLPRNELLEAAIRALASGVSVYDNKGCNMVVMMKVRRE